MHAGRLGATVAVGALLLAACSGGGAGSGSGLGNGLPSTGAGAATRAGTIAVVAGENTWGSVLAQIGGPAVSVRSIVNDPNADPHQYESSVDDAAAVAHARLVVANGLGYDDFLTRLLAVSHPAGRTVLTVAHVVGVHGSNPNPHLWYQPDYVRTAARAFESALAAIDPTRSASFAANLQAFLAAEQQVIAVIDEIKARHAGEAIGYTERVAGYLVDAAGLTLGSPEGFALAVEDGDDPSPLDAATFDSAITRHRIKALLYNSQVTDDVTSRVRKLAISSHVAVVGMSETMPPGATDYQTWQIDQAHALLAALGG